MELCLLAGLSSLIRSNLPMESSEVAAAAFNSVFSVTVNETIAAEFGALGTCKSKSPYSIPPPLRTTNPFTIAHTLPPACLSINADCCTLLHSHAPPAGPLLHHSTAGDLLGLCSDIQPRLVLPGKHRALQAGAATRATQQHQHPPALQRQVRHGLR